MTEPWEEAMARLELRVGWDEADALTTIRKHIEDQAEGALELEMELEETTAQLTALSGLENAILAKQLESQAAELTRQAEWSAKQLVDLMDANIYQQRRMDEAVVIWDSMPFLHIVEGDVWDWTDWKDRMERALNASTPASSEPETPTD